MPRRVGGHRLSRELGLLSLPASDGGAARIGRSGGSRLHDKDKEDGARTRALPHANRAADRRAVFALPGCALSLGLRHTAIESLSPPFRPVGHSALLAPH